MQFNPHGYQKYCISRIIDTDKLGLFLDMGLGKTSIVLSAIKELKYNRFQVSKVLVIAPKKVAESTWVKEKDKWDHTKMLRVSKILGSEKKRIEALYTPADIYVINRENTVWLVDFLRNDWFFDMVVIDESSSFKSHKAKRFKALAAIAPNINRIVELTGTPSPNGLSDLWAQIYLLDEGMRLGKRFGGFRERYFNTGARHNGVVYNYTPKKGSRDSILSAISDICVSMKSEDYLSLPDITEHDIPVVLSDRAAKAYRELEREMVLALPDDEISVAGAAALSNKLLQLGNGALYDENRRVHEIHRCKIDAFTELVESLRASGKNALVFYNYQHDKERIIKALSGSGLNVRVLKNTEDQDAWNRGEVDILLAHPASAAYGLNLQEGGNHVVWFGLNWNYELYSQANKRLHRQGQKEKVIVHHLVCEGTRDEDVMNALKRKDDVQQFVMDSLKARIKKIKESENGKGAKHEKHITGSEQPSVRTA